MQLGEDHLDTGQTRAWLKVDRNASPVVADLHRTVGHQRHFDAVTHAGQRLVDRIVDDLPHAVHEPARVGGADIHARTLADRLKTLEHLQVASHVIRCASIRCAGDRRAGDRRAACRDGLLGAGGGGHRRPFGATEGRPGPTAELPRRLSLTYDDQPTGTRHTGVMSIARRAKHDATLSRWGRNALWEAILVFDCYIGRMGLPSIQTAREEGTNVRRPDASETR